MCTWIALENYNNNDQQFNRHDFQHEICHLNILPQI